LTAPNGSKENEDEKQEKTEILYGVENAVSTGIRFMQNAKKSMDLFGDKNGPSIVIEFPDIYKNNYIAAKRRGAKIRFITEITKDNIQYCKELMTFVDEFRHLEGFKGGIAVTESEYMATTTLRERQILTQVFYSNAKEVVEQGQYIFDTFWNKAIPYEHKIKEIEEGIKPEVIETIRDPVQIQMTAFELVKSAKDEILTIFSTADAFLRQVRAGAIGLLHEAAERGVIVKILTPLSDSVKYTVLQEILQEHKKIDTRYIGESLQSKVSILIIDRKFSLVVELKDDTKETSYEAIGLATYSNSKPTVISFASIFESLWIQSDLYERLKVHDMMQKEFIDIAAHELRTPIQPILGLAQVLSQDIKDANQLQLIDVVIRNARRLQRLTEDILDVTKIESQSLQLNKETFNLTELIINAIADSKNQLKKDSNKRIELASKESVFVEADKARISQVIINLINNAIKFTQKDGIIIIMIENEEQGNNQILVSVKDTGTGIDPEILPRLFTKFATKSETGGTGLGLFISKSIVKAHGGRIWAENNKYTRGATFYFTLPLGR
jgi:two-component system, OmpR family, sensor histidine kinase VicK